MRVGALFHQILWAEMVHFAVKSGGFVSEVMISICVKLISSVHLPKCEANCVRNKLITDAFFYDFCLFEFQLKHLRMQLESPARRSCRNAG